MITYPTTFPCVSRVEGFSAAIAAGVVRTPMESGNSRQRRAHRVLPHTFSLVFMVDQSIWSSWLGWVNGHAWDDWVNLLLPTAAASHDGLAVELAPVRFISDLQVELVQVFRLWLWRVRVQAEYLPDPADLVPVYPSDWIIAGKSATPSPGWIIGGSATHPSPAWISASIGAPAVPA